MPTPANPPQKSIAASAVSAALPQIPVQQIAVQTGTHVYQGPIPPPEVLRGFEDVVEGSAKQLIQLAENESIHRRQLESAAMSANIAAQEHQLTISQYQSKAVFRSDTIGQIFGLIVSLACIAGAIYLAINGQQTVAIALAAIPTAAVIRAFFTRTHQVSPTQQPSSTAKK